MYCMSALQLAAGPVVIQTMIDHRARSPMLDAFIQKLDFKLKVVLY